MDRFAREILIIEGIHEETVLYALSVGMRPTFFAKDLVRKPPSTFAEAMERSHVESNVEDYFGAKIQDHKRQQKHKDAPPRGGGQQPQQQQSQLKSSTAQQATTCKVSAPRADGSSDRPRRQTSDRCSSPWARNRQLAIRETNEEGHGGV